MKTTQPTVKIGASLFIAACGTAALIHLYPEKLRTPEWIALLAVGMFAFAGACMAAQALGLHRLVRWLVCALLGAMTAVPAWIAFGAGARRCTVVWLGAGSATPEVLCRGAFGVGAVILAGMFVVAVRRALRARHVVTDRPAPSRSARHAP